MIEGLRVMCQISSDGAENTYAMALDYDISWRIKSFSCATQILTFDL